MMSNAQHINYLNGMSHGKHTIAQLLDQCKRFVKIGEDTLFL